LGPALATVYRIANMSDEQVYLDGNGTTRRRRERYPPHAVEARELTDQRA